MISQEALERLAERLVQRTQELNTYMLKKLAHQIKTIGSLTPSQAQEILQSLKYGADLDEIINELARITNLNVNDIYDIFEEVAKESQYYAKQFYEYRKIKFIPYEENEELQRQVRAMAKVTAENYINLARTSAYKIIDENGIEKYKNLSETYQEITDKAILNIVQGRESYEEVMRKTMRELSSSGLQMVDYSSGYHKRMDSAVRMNIMDGVRTLNQTLLNQFGEEFGADGVEVSHHKNSAPDHIDSVDGKQFTNEEYRSVNEKLTRPVGTLNCYHFSFPIILGISKPLVSKSTLESDKKANIEGFEFEDIKYTNYDGTQLQRRIETRIRKYKDRQIASNALEDEEDVYYCQEKITQLSSKYNQLCKISGLPKKVDRLRVEGYKKIK
jgi:hypothetical protein